MTPGKVGRRSSWTLDGHELYLLSISRLFTHYNASRRLHKCNTKRNMLQVITVNRIYRGQHFALGETILFRSRNKLKATPRNIWNHSMPGWKVKVLGRDDVSCLSIKGLFFFLAGMHLDKPEHPLLIPYFSSIAPNGLQTFLNQMMWVQHILHFVDSIYLFNQKLQIKGFQCSR